MAVGYDALTLFGVARRLARQEAFHSVPDSQSSPESATEELDNLLAQRAQRALRISGVDEPALFDFVDRLTRMIHDYRADERLRWQTTQNRTSGKRRGSLTTPLAMNGTDSWQPLRAMSENT